MSRVSGSKFFPPNMGTGNGILFMLRDRGSVQLGNTSVTLEWFHSHVGVWLQPQPRGVSKLGGGVGTFISREQMQPEGTYGFLLITEERGLGSSLKFISNTV